MKFYKSYSYYSYNLKKIISENLNAIYSYYDVLFFKNGKEYNDKNAAYISFINKQFILFFKNGNFHNNKNAAFIENTGYKEFHLNDQYYGNNTNFTKSSWRKFIKLQTFL